MTSVVQESYQHCARIAREAASNFYWSFWLLPRAKRKAMWALYAFSRRTDDLSDSTQPVLTKKNQLASWRQSLASALEGEFDDPLLPALADTVGRYDIPSKYLFDIISGVEMDLHPRRYQTFEELQNYCYHVASAVGLACIHVWGFQSPKAFEPAIKCGQAFQLTNILRDLQEDAQRGRIYLPLEDLQRFDYSPQELLSGVCDERLYELIGFEIERAEQLYREADPLSELLDRDGRRILKMMTVTYYRLLHKIKCYSNELLSKRIRLAWNDKAAVLWRTLC